VVGRCPRQRRAAVLADATMAAFSRPTPAATRRRRRWRPPRRPHGTRCRALGHAAAGGGPHATGRAGLRAPSRCGPPARAPAFRANRGPADAPAGAPAWVVSTRNAARLESRAARRRRRRQWRRRSAAAACAVAAAAARRGRPPPPRPPAYLCVDGAAFPAAAVTAAGGLCAGRPAAGGRCAPRPTAAPGGRCALWPRRPLWWCCPRGAPAGRGRRCGVWAEVGLHCGAGRSARRPPPPSPRASATSYKHPQGRSRCTL
jgi:hypothetical protein